MSSNKVFTVKELLERLSDVSFSDLKRQKTGYVSWINMKDKGRMKRIYVKTPKMFAPFGATNYNASDSSNNKKFSVALSFKGIEENNDLKELKNLLEKLDNMVVDNTYKNKDWRKQISKKSVSKDVIETNYTSVYREGQDDGEKKYPGLFNLKASVQWKDGEPSVATKVYDTNKKEIEINFDNYNEVIPRLTDLKCVFQVASVWFINKKFGLTLKLVQAKVFPNEMGGNIDECVFDDEEDIEETTKKITKKMESLKVVEKKKIIEEEESDDEDEESESED